MRRAFVVIALSAALCNIAWAGSALYFDGDDYAHAPYISTYNMPVFTVEAWVNPVSTGGTIVSRGEDFTTDHSAFNLGYAPAGTSWGEGVGMWYEDNVNIDYDYASGRLLNTNTWTHVAATRDSSGKLSIYVNGSVVRQWTSTGVPASNCLQELDIGAYWNNDGGVHSLSFYNGIMDEVRLWNVARTSTEMAQYYNRTVNPASAGLVGYWNFDEGTGVTANDLTGRNNAMLGLNGTGTDIPDWILSTAPIVPEPATLLLIGLGGMIAVRKQKRN